MHWGRGREREDVGQVIVSNTSISTAAMCFHSCIHPSILLSCCTATHIFILKAQCGRVQQQQQQTFATRRPTQPLRTNDSCVLGTASNAQRSATNSAEESERERERGSGGGNNHCERAHTHTHNEDDSFFFLLWRCVASLID